MHAHPPTATGFAVAGIALDRPLIAEAVVTLGPVPVIPYGQPSTEELADNVGRAVCDAQALLMANHGALAVGDTLERAWERMETLEQLARVTLVTRHPRTRSAAARGRRSGAWRSRARAPAIRRPAC